MKVLVSYYSETGNTEKVARAIHEEVSKEHVALLEPVKKVTIEDLTKFDLIFLGSPCHSADLSVPVKRILDEFPRSPRFKLAGFFTCAATLDTIDKYAGKCMISFEKACKEKGVDFLGCYNCQGNPSPQLTKSMKAGGAPLSDDEMRKYFDEVVKHPTPKDLQKAKGFARKILEKFS
jgi:flavodoxin